MRTKNKGIWLTVSILTTLKMPWDLWHWEWDLWYKLDWELGSGQNLGWEMGFGKPPHDHLQ